MPSKSGSAKVVATGCGNGPAGAITRRGGGWIKDAGGRPSGAATPLNPRGSDCCTAAIRGGLFGKACGAWRTPGAGGSGVGEASSGARWLGRLGGASLGRTMRGPSVCRGWATPLKDRGSKFGCWTKLGSGRDVKDGN